MRILVSILLALTLAACEAPAPQPTAPAMGLDVIIDAVVEEANGDKGQELAGGLIVDGAHADGNKVIFTFIMTQDLETFRAVPRADLETMLTIATRPSACANAGIEAFIRLGGRLQMNFIDPARQPMAAIVVDRC